jgi:nicotinamidase-related amidase
MPTLLVIDIQRGAFDGVRCPVIDTPEPFVARARALVDAARAGNHPIVFVQHCETTPGEVFEEGSAH